MRIAADFDSRTQLERAWLQTKLLERTTPVATNRPDPESFGASKFLRPGKVGAVLALLVGTGGVATSDYVLARDYRGYPLHEFEYRSPHKTGRLAAVEVRTPIENLNRVRAVLMLSITELASLFSVSRQAIYNWQAGERISQQNEARLDQLGRAVDLLDDAGLAGKPSLLRRKLPGGKALLEAVRSGEPAEPAAARLIELVKRETAERRALTARLANKPRKPVDLAEVGSPFMKEES